MVVKVSVVVPVYNPGRYLEPLIASLDRQSLPPSEFEAIFVDDGSTDGSGERLDRLAEERENVRVVHIPNSGWPGKPRNVGIDQARGRYVLFVDNDDWLGDEALERLYDFAERNGADVVVGKEVGHGKGVPRNLFRRNVDDASLDNAPLLDLLTPHKLFRRSFLDEHRIRFPEGRRRLEDHPFVLAAYFKADRISILADYPAYHWIERDDTGNATNRQADPAGYYENVREILDIVDDHVPAGRERDRFYAHWYRSKGLERLRGTTWAVAPDEEQLAVFAEVRRLALERIGPAVDHHLPMKFRVRSRAVREDRPDLITAQAAIEHGMRAPITLHSLERTGDRLHLCLSATLHAADGQPIRFRRKGDRLLWDPPGDLAGDRALRDEDLDVTDEIGRAGLAVIMRQRDLRVEHDRPATVERILDGGDRPTLQLLVRAEIDLARIAAGSELADGVWDLFAHVHACGWRVVPRIGDVAKPEALARPVRLHTTQYGNLSLKVGSGVARVPRPPRPVTRPDPAPKVPPAPSRRLRLPTLLRRLVHLLPMPIRRTGRRVVLRASRQPR